METPLAILFGCIVGFSLGLTGGGGAIFAVPLLVYGLNTAPREAVLISLFVVGVTAFVGFVERALKKTVEFPTALLFGAAGMTTAPVGARLAAMTPEWLLLLGFSGLMILIAGRMWLKASADGHTGVGVPIDDNAGPHCKRDPAGKLQLTSRCALLLTAVGLATGVLTGFFGVGGGFLIVPALMTFSGMGIQRAVGTSLLVITLVSASGIGSSLYFGEPIQFAVRTSLFAWQSTWAGCRHADRRSSGRTPTAAGLCGGYRCCRDLCPCSHLAELARCHTRSGRFLCRDKRCLRYRLLRVIFRMDRIKIAA